MVGFPKVLISFKENVLVSETHSKAAAGQCLRVRLQLLMTPKSKRKSFFTFQFLIYPQKY